MPRGFIDRAAVRGEIDVAPKCFCGRGQQYIYLLCLFRDYAIGSCIGHIGDRSSVGGSVDAERCFCRDWCMADVENKLKSEGPADYADLKQRYERLHLLYQVTMLFTRRWTRSERWS